MIRSADLINPLAIIGVELGVPNKAPAKPKPLYRRKPPPPPTDVTSGKWQVTRKTKAVGRESSRAATPQSEFRHPHLLAPAHFTLREDGSVAGVSDLGSRVSGTDAPDARRQTLSPRLAFSSNTPFIRLYHGNSLELLDAIYAKYGDAGRFDAIFAIRRISCLPGRSFCLYSEAQRRMEAKAGPTVLNHKIDFNAETQRRKDAETHRRGFL